MLVGMKLPCSVWVSTPLLLLLTTPLLVGAATPAKPVVLVRNQALRSGTVVREKREIRVERGRSKQTQPNETSDQATRYTNRLNLVRKVGGGNEDLRVSDLVTEWTHFNGLTPPPANEQSSPLANQNLRARKTGARWSYELSQGKPTPEQRQALDQLAMTHTLLDLLPLFIGSEAHKPGDSWKTQVPAPRGRAVGYIVPKDLECQLLDVTSGPEGTLAKIQVQGEVGLERPLDYSAHVDITFSGVVVRRLEDMLDVETKLQGTYLLKGEAEILGVGKAQLEYDYPYTLVRTQKIETP